MGQKSNINSLRLLNQTNLSNNNIKLNFVEITIVKYLRFLLKKKEYILLKQPLVLLIIEYTFFFMFFITRKK